MQGFIIHTFKIKDEDLLVTVLNSKSVKTLYRFYGARHSHVHLGYKIDYEAHPTKKEDLFLLRSVSLLPYKWMFKTQPFYIWQQFLKLLYNHLRDIDDIDPFYYELLSEMCIKLEKQNPKRVCIESFAKLLDFEGRIHKENVCFVCNKEIKDRVVLVRSYLPACENCIKRDSINKKQKDFFLKEKNSVILNDKEVENLYEAMLEGF